MIVHPSDYPKIGSLISVIVEGEFFNAIVTKHHEGGITVELQPHGEEFFLWPQVWYTFSTSKI